MSRLLCALICSVSLLASPLPAFAGIDKLMEKFKSLGHFPSCDDPKVLGQIVERFNWAEENTWHRGFYLEDITRTRERVVQDGHHRQVPRRYCRGHAKLTNGRHPTLMYLIEEGAGFAGTGFNVEFCINGLDPWRVHDGSCRVLNY